MTRDAAGGSQTTAEDRELAGRLREVERSLLARWPESRIDPSLERISRLLDLLGNPQQASPSIHVTGTNGKTSVARMIDALLRAFGLRTGRYTSPHLQSIRERICVDGEPLSVRQMLDVYADVAPFLPLADDGAALPLSYFEVLTGMAFAAFADAPVDVAVLEVGLGGRWDATNVADSAVAVVTPISLDHQEYLGDTLELIAAEKVGVVKPGATAVIASQPSEAEAALARGIREADAQVLVEGEDFGVLYREVALGGQLLTLRTPGGHYDEIFLPLHGAHQASNAALALTAVEVFLGGSIQGVAQRLDLEIVREGFAAVTSPGRLEVVRRSPSVLVDAAHNPAGAAALAAAIEDGFAFSQLVGLIAVLADKDAEGILGELEPVLNEVVVSQNSSPRALPADELAAIAQDVFGEHRVTVVERLDEALTVAIELAESGGGELGGTGVLVTGSVVTAGEVRGLLGGQPG